MECFGLMDTQTIEQPAKLFFSDQHSFIFIAWPLIFRFVGNGLSIKFKTIDAPVKNLNRFSGSIRKDKHSI